MGLLFDGYCLRNQLCFISLFHNISMTCSLNSGPSAGNVPVFYLLLRISGPKQCIFISWMWNCGYFTALLGPIVSGLAPVHQHRFEVPVDCGWFEDSSKNR